MVTKKHSDWSASGSHRWMNCPGSIELSKKAPPSFESEYAKEGTRAHECLEFLLKNRGAPGEAFEIAYEKYGHEITEHAVSAIEEIAKRTSKDVTILCETKVSLAHIHPDMHGTVDAAIVDEFATLTVVDFKYGAGVPVDPEWNPQLLYYALGLAHQYDYNFSHVKLVIIQPRAEHERGPVREWGLRIDELLDWGEKLKKAVKDTLRKDAPLKSGDHCRWCPAAAICPELSERAMEQAQIDFSPTAGTLALPDPELHPIYKGVALGNILDAADKIETWIGKVREVAFQRLSRGEKITGYKLVEKRSTRKWTDPEKVAKEAKKLVGDRAFKHELLSPAQLEKVIPNKDWIARRCLALSSGITLVRETDKRPAVNQIEQDFGESQ